MILRNLIHPVQESTTSLYLDAIVLTSVHAVHCQKIKGLLNKTHFFSFLFLIFFFYHQQETAAFALFTFSPLGCVGFTLYAVRSLLSVHLVEQSAFLFLKSCLVSIWLFCSTSLQDYGIMYSYICGYILHYVHLENSFYLTVWILEDIKIHFSRMSVKQFFMLLFPILCQHAY